MRNGASDSQDGQDNWLPRGARIVRLESLRVDIERSGAWGPAIIPHPCGQVLRSARKEATSASLAAWGVAPPSSSTRHLPSLSRCQVETKVDTETRFGVLPAGDSSNA